jgi:hypothetical protein
MKLITAHITKTLKAAVVSTAAFAFLTGSFLCCCLPKMAHASTAHKACCAKKSDDQTTKTSKSCDHCKIKTVDVDCFVSEGQTSSAKSFLTAWAASTLTYLQPHFSTYLACAGPPRNQATLPLYLLHSNLRL